VVRCGSLVRLHARPQPLPAQLDSRIEERLQLAALSVLNVPRR
jgi:hypothetical protein